MANPKQAPFLTIAAALFGLALGLTWLSDPWRTAGAANATVIAPNVLAGLAALGFAIAGGLAVVAAALASRDQLPPGP